MHLIGGHFQQVLVLRHVFHHERLQQNLLLLVVCFTTNLLVGEAAVPLRVFTLILHRYIVLLRLLLDLSLQGRQCFLVFGVLRHKLEELGEFRLLLQII